MDRKAEVSPAAARKDLVVRLIDSLAKLGAVAAALITFAEPLAAQDMRRLTERIEAWLASPHANHHSESFTYWNKEGQVPAACATCHSQPGFIDFLGADKSEAGKVDQPAAINAPIGCASCHTSAAHALNSVRFPSGVVIDQLGPSAVCNVCHQGRASSDRVVAATKGLGEDDVSPKLTFIDIHYGVAAAVMRGTQVRGGYQYPGHTYAGRFQHVPSANTCVGCHNPHAAKVETSGCSTCHRGINNLRAIRTRHVDFDGDGLITAGVHAEIAGLHRQLLEAIKVYATKIANSPIGYASGTFPYFFVDSDGDGRINEVEATMPNRYRPWTPRLLKAAYNFQVVSKDAGAYTHNPTYALQLLYDSLMSLAERVDLDTDKLRRP